MTRTINKMLLVNKGMEELADIACIIQMSKLQLCIIHFLMSEPHYT